MEEAPNRSSSAIRAEIRHERAQSGMVRAVSG